MKKHGHLYKKHQKTLCCPFVGEHPNIQHDGHLRVQFDAPLDGWCCTSVPGVSGRRYTWITDNRVEQNIPHCVPLPHCATHGCTNGVKLGVCVAAGMWAPWVWFNALAPTAKVAAAANAAAPSLGNGCLMGTKYWTTQQSGFLWWLPISLNGVCCCGDTTMDIGSIRDHIIIDDLSEVRDTFLASVEMHDTPLL